MYTYIHECTCMYVYYTYYIYILCITCVLGTLYKDCFFKSYICTAVNEYECQKIMPKPGKNILVRRKHFCQKNEPYEGNLYPEIIWQRQLKHDNHFDWTSLLKWQRRLYNEGDANNFSQWWMPAEKNTMALMALMALTIWIWIVPFVLNQSHVPKMMFRVSDC